MVVWRETWRGIDVRGHPRARRRGRRSGDCASTSPRGRASGSPRRLAVRRTRIRGSGAARGRATASSSCTAPATRTRSGTSGTAPERSFAGWYVNLQEPFVRDGRAFVTQRPRARPLDHAGRLVAVEGRGEARRVGAPRAVHAGRGRRDPGRGRARSRGVAVPDRLGGLGARPVLAGARAAAHWSAEMRDGFLLDPDVVQLNHGSFGACPVPVFEEYQAIQRELEAGRRTSSRGRSRAGSGAAPERPGRLAEARASLAAFVGARADDLVFVPNATSGLNAVIRSLRLEPGDEVLTTAHEYGAITRTWEFAGANARRLRAGRGRRADRAAHARGLRLAHHLADGAASSRWRRSARRRVRPACSRSWTARTRPGRSRSTSTRSARTSTRATATSGCARRRAPASCGLGRSSRSWIEPLVVSWGWREDADFAERHGWAGTRDPAAYLTVPKAIEVHATFDARARSERSRTMPSAGSASSAVRASRASRRRSCARSSCRRATRTSSGGGSTRSIRVEAPVYEWEGRRLLRVSIGPYNDEDGRRPARGCARAAPLAVGSGKCARSIHYETRGRAHVLAGARSRADPGLRRSRRRAPADPEEAPLPRASSATGRPPLPEPRGR